LEKHIGRRRLSKRIPVKEIFEFIGESKRGKVRGFRKKRLRDQKARISNLESRGEKKGGRMAKQHEIGAEERETKKRKKACPSRNSKGPKPKREKERNFRGG